LVDKILRAPSNVAKALLAKVFGERFVDDLEEFFLVMQGIHAEVRQRSENVQRLLRDPQKTSFLLVTAPIPSVAKSAVFFHDQIRKRGFPFAGFIVNRVHPTPSADALALSGEDIQSALEALDAPAPSAGLGGALMENAARMSELAARDRRTISALRARMIGSAPMTRVPRLGGAIHDVLGLALIAEHIFTADQGSEATTS
jgi:anion-transporting  ArsA/GET3 family ATPase